MEQLTFDEYIERYGLLKNYRGLINGWNDPHEGWYYRYLESGHAPEEKARQAGIVSEPYKDQPQEIEYQKELQRRQKKAIAKLTPEEVEILGITVQTTFYKQYP